MAKKVAEKNIKTEIQPETVNYPKIIDRRLQQIRFQLEDQKAECICILNLTNIRYLTNFSGSNAVLFVKENEIHFVTDDRYEEQIKTELYQLPNLKTHITRNTWTYINPKNVLAGVESIAFESEFFPYSDAVEIRNLLRPVKFKPAPNMITRFMQSKDPQEVAYIKTGLEISQKVYEYMLGFIKPGMTEKDLSAEIAYQVRKLGSEGEPSENIIVSGPRGTMIFGNPTDRKIKKNELIIIDFGTRINGFGTDISRTISTGKLTKDQKNMYDVLRKAQKAAIKEVRPGMNGRHLDKIVRGIITDAGFGDYFKHTSGHGIGIKPVESPWISNFLDGEQVPEDSVLGIEPGIYCPDKFGMRSEEVILVKYNGGEILLPAPEEIPVI